MRLSTKIESCAATKDIRYYLNGVFFSAEHNRAVATDGHCLAMVPMQVEESGIVPTDAIRQYRKVDRKKTPAELDINGKIEVSSLGQHSTFDKIDGTFPDYEKVIPKREERFLVFNAEFLLRVQNALLDTDSKTRGVRVYIPENHTSAIRIEPVDGSDERVGVIMPMRDRRA